MFIDLFHCDLTASYIRIKNSRHYLLGKWRFELLKAYSKRRDQYAAKAGRQQAQKAKFKRALPWLGIVLLVSCAGGYWLTSAFFCFGALLMIVAAGLGAWYSRKAKPPENPIAQNSGQKYTSPLKQRLFASLIPEWRDRISVAIPNEDEVNRLANQSEKWGLIGEFNLIRELGQIVSRDTLILHSLMPKEKDDMDVVVIGPKGFWYFEVKYLNASIEWQQGAWNIKRMNQNTGRMEKVVMNEYPDAQWYRMRKEAIQNIKFSGESFLARAPMLGDMKDGIVFAHPKATFNIQKSPPFPWGAIPAWIREYKNAPMIQGVTFELVLQLADILLKRHQGLNPNIRVHSMSTVGATILQAREEKILNWIRAS